MWSKVRGVAALNAHEIHTNQMERKINIVALIVAIVAALRIIMVCFACGSLYSFGIFYLAVVIGIYCILKNSLFLNEVFFPVWVRLLLALLFTGTQMLGMYISVPGMKSRMSIVELVLLTLCLTPLTFGAQNMLFNLVAARCGRTKEEDASKSGIVRENTEFPRLKHFFGAYAVILAGFMIPFATYYPAIMAYDIIPQLTQIRDNAYTTHHPLIHTLMIKMSLKIGELLPGVHNVDRAGLATYVILQMLIVAGCFAYVYIYMRIKGVHKYLCCFYVLCVAFYPTHGMLAVSITKDTIYSVLVMMFTVFVWDMLSWDEERISGKWMGAYVLLTVLLLLFRNNSVYAWFVYVIVLSFVLHKKAKMQPGGGNAFLKKFSILHVASFVLYLLLNRGMVMATGAVNTTYVREMLSVPAQQIARVVAFHEEQLTVQDKEWLEIIWGEDTLPEYVPAIADRSKRDIADDKEVLVALAKEWLSLGVRYPDEYIMAFMHKNKGMWYFEDSTYLNDIYSYATGYLQIAYPGNQQEYIDRLVPGYQRHQKLQFLQTVYKYFGTGYERWKYIPPIALVMQPAFYCWMLFYYCLCCVGLRRGRWLIPAVYLLALTGTVLLGPCVLIRYMYPLMLAVTVLVMLAFNGIVASKTISTDDSQK